MPAYNAEEFISEAIESVRKQTYTAWELIVIDDGSIDGTKRLVENFQKDDDRIVYIYQKNQRLGAARNCGFRNAKGRYIAFLDSDDLWLPHKLQIQLSAFESNAVDLIYTDGFILNEADQSLEPYLTIFGSFSSVEMYKILFTQNYIPVLSVLMKKEWVDKVGFQLETKEIFGCEDWDYWLRTAKEGATFLGLQEKLFYYRKHSNNMSNSNLTMRIGVATVHVRNINIKLLNKDIVTNVYSRLSHLFNDLLKNNRIDEAIYIAKSLNNINPRFKSLTRYYLVRYFKSNSVKIFDIISLLKNKVGVQFF